MIDLLFTLFAFVIALSVLIAVHEFGHFWVARRMGVKVLRFSIGFGRPLWTTRRGADRTEYVVAAVPLGGYVKMLDEREGEVAPEEVGRAFNRQHVAKRFAIVAAGPLFNLLFAVLAYWAMFVIGVPGLKPLIGEVEPHSIAAQAGLRPGSEIIAVADQPTPTWAAVFEEILPYALRKEGVEITVESEGVQEKIGFPLDAIDEEVKPEALAQVIGFVPYRPVIPAIVGEVLPGSAAERAGLREGDRIAAVNGEPIVDWEEVVEAVRASPGRPMTFAVERGGAVEAVEVRPDRVESETGPMGRIGAGVKLDTEALEELESELRYGPVRALSEAAARTWEMSTLTLGMLGEMLVGRASVENISGPITIARFAKSTAEAGFVQFLGFLAIVSVSLGVLNFLPVPVLDGGHLLFYLVEVVKGSPMSEKTEMVAQKVGIAIILMLMAIAFYNDFARLAA